MHTTRQLHDLGQNLWLYGANRDLLSVGTVERCIDELPVTYPTTAIRIG